LNTLAINDEGRKTIEEAQRNLAAQSKEVDDQIAILGKEGTGAAEIAAAATKAIEQVSSYYERNCSTFFCRHMLTTDNLDK
jgi:hypothetical protein